MFFESKRESVKDGMGIFSMLRPALLVLLFCAAGQSLSAEIHIQLEIRQNFVDYDQTYVVDIWLAEGKSFSREGRRAVIFRKDRGVKWIIDFDRNYYTEILLEEDILPAEIDEDNLRTAGFYYHPDYEWNIQDTGETEIKDGYSCRIYTALGEADYADVESRYWICLDETHREGLQLRDYMIDRLIDEPEAEPLRRLLFDLGTGFPVYWEEADNGPITPLTVRKTRLILMETVSDAPSRYELPAGLNRRR